MRPVHWVGTARKDLKEFPAEVQHMVGYALYLAQTGGKHPAAKVLKGFGGAGVLEVVEHFDGNACRTVYTVRFAEAVYVLHAFQKKSRRGIKTPAGDLEVVRSRLARAREAHLALVATREE